MPVTIVRNDELAHHGILGQKWGKRNGPPYPLDSEDHSKSEEKAGWRNSLDSSYKKISKQIVLNRDKRHEKKEIKKMSPIVRKEYEDKRTEIINELVEFQMPKQKGGIIRDVLQKSFDLSHDFYDKYQKRFPEDAKYGFEDGVNMAGEFEYLLDSVPTQVNSSDVNTVELTNKIFDRFAPMVVENNLVRKAPEGLFFEEYCHAHENEIKSIISSIIDLEKEVIVLSDKKYKRLYDDFVNKYGDKKVSEILYDKEDIKKYMHSIK